MNKRFADVQERIVRSGLSDVEAEILANEIRRKTISRIAKKIDDEDAWGFMEDALPKYKVTGLLKELLDEGRISYAFPVVGNFKARPEIYRVKTGGRK